MNNLKKIDAQELGQGLNKLTISLMKITDKIWDSQNYIQIVDRFYYTIFLKVTYILDNIIIQVFNLDNKPHFIFGTALQLRTALLDIISLYYVIDSLDDKQESIKRVNAILADHLRYILNDLTADEKQQIIKLWPDLFDENNNLKVFDKISTVLFQKNVINFPNLMEEVKSARNYYNILSKFEHNGAFTFDMLHMYFTDESKLKMKSLIKDSLITCALGLHLVSKHWLKDDDLLFLELTSNLEELCIIGNK